MENGNDLIMWQYCHDPNDINKAIDKHDEDWEGLTSAEQIISITYDTNHGCYVAFWRRKQGRKEAQPDESKYEYHYDHTDCIWYRPEARNRCPVTCAQYRDGWNDAMNYIFRDGKGYKPYRRDKQYEE